MQFRLSNKKILQKLLERGFPLNIRTVGRIKKKLKTSQRLDEIVEEESQAFIIESIGSTNFVEKKAQEVFDESKNDYVKLQALNMILKSRKERAEYYDAANVAALLEKKKNDTLEKN